MKKFLKEDINYKIVSLLERIGLVFRVLTFEAAKKERLSPTQIQFLLYLYNHKKTASKAIAIAREFNLTAATVSEVITSLKRKKLINKKINKKDGRVLNLQITASGKKLACKLSDWTSILWKTVNKFSKQSKENSILFLMELIAELQKQRIITIAKMCITCGNFKKNAYPTRDKPHHCKLTNKPLANSDLNLNCDNHQLVEVS